MNISSGNSVLVGVQEHSVTFFLPNIFSPFGSPHIDDDISRKRRGMLES